MHPCHSLDAGSDEEARFNDAFVHMTDSSFLRAIWWPFFVTSYTFIRNTVIVCLTDNMVHATAQPCGGVSFVGAQ